MRMRNGLKIMLGSVLVATAIYALLAAPGLLTDLASTVPARQHIATVRP